MEIEKAIENLCKEKTDIIIRHGQTRQYINVATSDVNNYEKILTHTIGDLVKNLAFSVGFPLRGDKKDSASSRCEPSRSEQTIGRPE